jgi:hypothetical protein
MPTPEALDRFIARVEENAHADASMQENQSAPRVGRNSHVANERRVLAHGTVTHMEELAYQRWEGDRLAEETFFYDPAQRAPKKIDE